jgi:protein MpaA
VKKTFFSIPACAIAISLGSFIPSESGVAGDSAPHRAEKIDGTVASLCAELKPTIESLRWKDIDPCTGIDWKIHGKSVQGRPLIYAEFGDPASTNVTLIFSSVHGDEITPVYLGFKIARWTMDHQAELKNARIIVAPFVNPDGFYKKPRTRMNARGVDVNRNFATRDWNARALSTWHKSLRSDIRRFPGNEPASEPETRFQQQLIKKFGAKKILSIHAPLNHLDYDGPNTLSLARFPSEYVHECLKLRTALKAVSTGYFPGSLGNYAGQEMGIPTLTLELPTANPAKAEEYWQSFQSGIQKMMEFVIPDSRTSGNPPDHEKAL